MLNVRCPLKDVCRRKVECVVGDDEAFVGNVVYGQEWMYTYLHICQFTKLIVYCQLFVGFSPYFFISQYSSFLKLFSEETHEYTQFYR